MSKPSFQMPLFRFMHICKICGGVNYIKINRLLPWAFKLILLEPFRIIESILFDNKIKQTTLRKDPIIILGFYRSGTTYLQRLFIQNKRFGYQTIFHSAVPEICLGFTWLFKPVFSIFTSTLRLKNKFHKVPFTWDFPGEEDVAITSLSLYESPNWGNLFPLSFFNQYQKYAWSSPDSDLSNSWSQKYQYWIKKLSLINNNKQLVLKSPPNTSRIETLLEIFPNAKFVCLHRDPQQIYKSLLSFWEILDKNYCLQNISKNEIEKIIIQSYDRTMKIYHSIKSKIPKENLCEVRYESLKKAPYSCFKMIYDRLGFDDFESFKNGLKEFISSTQNYPFVKYELTLTEDSLVSECWPEHVKYWNDFSDI